MSFKSMIVTATLLAALLCEVTTLTTIAAESQTKAASSIVPLDEAVY